MIELALKTGIAPSVWADEGLAAIATAEELIEQAYSNTGTTGPQMSG